MKIGVKLTPAERTQVYAEILQGSVAAVNKLVLSYDNYFKGVAQQKMRKYNVAQSHFEDVLNLFRLTALKMAPKFDGNKASFPHFLRFPLELAMSEYVSKTCRPLSTVPKITQELVRMNARISHLEAQGQVVSQDSILEKCKVTPSLVERYIRTGQMIEFGMSLDVPLAEDGGSLHDTLCTETPEGFELLLKVEMQTIVQTVVESLDPREAEVIRRRYLGDDLVTLDKVSQYFGVTNERVRQIEVEALRKIKVRLINRYRVRAMDDVIMA